MRACHNLARIRRNIHTRDSLVMACQLILQLEFPTLSLVQVDVVFAGYGERLAVGGEGVVRDGVVEEVMDFWGGHFVGRCAIGDSLLLQVRAYRRLAGVEVGAWRGRAVMSARAAWHFGKVDVQSSHQTQTLDSRIAIDESARPTLPSFS